MALSISSQVDELDEPAAANLGQVHMPALAHQKAQTSSYSVRVADSAAWYLLVAITALSAMCMSFTGVSVDWLSALTPLVALLGLIMVTAFYRSWRPDERIATSVTAVAQLVAFTAVGSSLSYAVASSGGALWDETLMGWDRGLGLDWRSYLSFVDARPWLGLIFTLAYQSIVVQMIIIVIALGFNGRILACREFVLAVIIAGLASICISAFMPAMAMFVHLGLTPNDFPNLDPNAAFVHVEHLTGLRNGTFREVSLGSAEGIITFPSYHAALGVIFATAFWQLRWTRWPGLILNLLLIAATPVDGGHYFVDVIAGVIIAAFAIQVARILQRCQFA